LRARFLRPSFASGNPRIRVATIIDSTHSSGQLTITPVRNSLINHFPD
jgi:hypothetical protein